MGKPKLKLTGLYGNAFSIIGRALKAAKASGSFSNDDIEKFKKEAKSGDYDNLLQTCMEYFDVC